MPTAVVPEISVIILNYNGRKWLRACLDALRGQIAALNFEIIVFDNASADESADLVRTSYPDVRLVTSAKNLGFAAGNNAAASHARGEWLAFLNNDTRPTAKWLAQLYTVAQERGEQTLVASRIVFLDDPDLVDSAGDGYLRAGGAFKRGHGAPSARFGEAQEVFGACGAAFLIHHDAFAALGGFDPRFFMVYEDVDLSYRARLRGMRCWYAPGAVVHHVGGGSIGAVSPETVYYGQRNLEWTWIKNTPAELLTRTAAAHALYSCAGVLHYVRMGRGIAAMRGKLAALAGLPGMLRERRRIQAARTATVSSLTAVMADGWIEAKVREKAFDAHRL